MSDDKPKKQFSKKQLRAGNGFLHQMAATNKFANQSGMSAFGAVRHCRDIVADDSDARGKGVLTKISATHLYASQKGMKPFGAVRYGRDIAADVSDQRGHGMLTKVAQTNIFASQKGMTAFGSVRHCADMRVKQIWEEDDGEYPADEEDEVKVDSQRRRGAAESSHAKVPEPVVV